MVFLVSNLNPEWGPMFGFSEEERKLKFELNFYLMVYGRTEKKTIIELNGYLNGSKDLTTVRHRSSLYYYLKL